MKKLTLSLIALFAFSAVAMAGEEAPAAHEGAAHEGATAPAAHEGAEPAPHKHGHKKDKKRHHKGTHGDAAAPHAE